MTGSSPIALPQRARAAHKGQHGHVLVIGGGVGMGGAARLAGEAALRAGAGLVTVAVHPSSVAALAARPELMSVSIGIVHDLHSALERATVIALGPGPRPVAVGNGSPGVRRMSSGKPLVVDADALNLLALTLQTRDDWVLTPHPGEAARLLGTTAPARAARPPGAAAALQERYGGTVVLKGAGSIVQTARPAPGFATAAIRAWPWRAWATCSRARSQASPRSVGTCPGGLRRRVRARARR